MVEETARLVLTRRDGCYLDLTCGGGGHLAFFSERLDKKAVLIGVDRDPEAVAATRKRMARAPQKTTIVKSNFGRLEEILEAQQVKEVDGILMDLGLSSHQVESPWRGFSFMHDGPLDMRLGDDTRLTARDIINDYSEKELVRIFREYGEEKRAVNAARAVIRARSAKPLETTGRLAEILKPVLHPKYRQASLARIFQSIRIEANRELETLRQTLPAAVDSLRVGGHLAVLAYHSLEDRIVKRFFADEIRGCICPPQLPECRCGRRPRLKALTRKPLKPQPDEIDRNRRARSARLRAVEKIAPTS